MPASLIPTFLFYCFVSMITPGPANLCSLYAAMRYGHRAALRQWRGLFTGFAFLSLVSVFIAYFLGTALGTYVRVLSIAGAAYMLYLAWKVFRSSGVGADNSREECNFKTGFLIQMGNVKIMIFCVTTMGSYVLPYNDSFLALLAMGLFLPFTGPSANLVWLFAGVRLKHLFDRHYRTINTVMALSLVWCAWSIVYKAFTMAG